ncbi:MAG: type II toxin-antitoxin system VapC family toxin [Anaerolineae bacterium]|nr:type II toxin-antitoxin system VapC family toxin [Anaerolineae bacterium]
MAVTRLGIDTDIVIDYLRGRSDLLERALFHYECAFTSITVYELLIGLAQAPRQAALFADALRLVQIVPFDLDAAHAAARVYEQLSVQGLPIGVQDMLNAGVCIAHGLPLLTRNLAHYGRIKGPTLFDAAQMI